METLTKPEQGPLLKEIADKLLVAHQEIDELTVQLALGKAEALDKFEEIKKDFRKRVQELKALTQSGDTKNITNIGKLEIQLELGKAKDPGAFEIQKRNILSALTALGEKLTESGAFHHEVEKFKLKIIILQLSLALKKFEIKDDFREHMAGARRKIEHIVGTAREKMKDGKEKYNDLRDEVQLAYKHMRKAIEKL